MPSALITAGVAAGVVGGVHAVAHYTTGEERYFDEAGVMWAGLAISATTFAVVWAVASTSAPTASLVPAGILGNPVWAGLLGLVAFLALVIVWNAGSWWVVNVIAQREPAVAALGVALVVFGGPTVVTVGGVAVGAAAAAGGVLVALALVAQYTDRLDF